MWQKSFTGEFAVSIDEANSWSTESLVPQQTAELELPDLQPLSLPIRVSKLTTTVSGFVFPEAQQWLPPTENRSEESRVKKKKKPVDRAAKNYCRIKPPNDVVKLHDRLYYLLQPHWICWSAAAS